MKNWSESEILLPSINATAAAEASSSLAPVIAVVFVVLLVAAMVWLLLKRGNRLIPLKKSPFQMKVLNHLPLGPKKYLTVVEVAGETLLLGVTDYSVNLIKSIALLDEDLDSHAKTSLTDERFSQVIVDRMLHSDSEGETASQVQSSVPQQDEFQITRMAEVVKDRINTMGPLP